MLVLKHYFRYFLPGKGSPRLNWGVNFVQLRVDRISDDAEIFANFILLCREYGIIFDFNRIKKDLKLSKITLRRVKRKLMIRG